MCFFLHTRTQAENTKIDSLTALLPDLEGVALADAYLRLSEEYKYITPVKTIEYAEHALTIVEDLGITEKICYANLLIGSGCIFSGNYTEGEKFTHVGLKLARELEDLNYESMGLSSLASCYMNAGDYTMALELYNKTLEQATRAGLEDRVARAKFNIGFIKTNKGDRVGGILLMSEALQYFESKDDVAVAARILNNIAVSYHSWKDYDLALEYYRKALQSYERNGDIFGKVYALNNIGEIYKDKGRYTMAQQYYSQIFDLAEENEISEFYLAVAWVGLAETYLKTGKTQLARQNAEQSLEVFQNANMHEGEIMANMVLAHVYMSDGELDRARRLADQCVRQAESIGTKDLMQKVYWLQSEVLEKQNNYRESLRSYKKYIEITDSLNKEMQFHQKALHRSELDISEKEKEIELLQKNNEIKDLELVRQKSQSRTLIILIGFLMVVIALSLTYNKARKKANILLHEKNKQILEQHEELIQVNQTKDKFLSIIGHDLRNPIGAFKDMVSQLSDFPEMFTEELRKQILEELRDEAESTYFLLDNLLLWAKSQQHSIQFKPEKLKLNLVIKNNVILNSRIAESKGVELKSNVSGEILAYADHNMVDLIIRNLISNAIKFTPGKGKVELNVISKAEFYEIQVKDEGVGIAEKDLSRLFDQNDYLSTYGTHNEKGSGLGLILCKEFVEKNYGTISIQSKEGKGSTFSFTLEKFNSAQA